MYIKEISKLLDIPVSIIYDELKRNKGRKEVVENTNKVFSFSHEDTAIAYIFSDTKYIEYISERIIFPETLSKDLEHCLHNFEDFKKDLELSKKEQYRALSMKVEEEEITEDILQNFIRKLNTELYKKMSLLIKEQMKNGDEQAFGKYALFLQKAKKHGLK